MLRPLFMSQSSKQVPYHTNSSNPRNIKPYSDFMGSKLPWNTKSANGASRRNSHSSFVKLQPTTNWAPTTIVYAAEQGNLEHNLDDLSPPVGPKDIFMTTRLDWEDHKRSKR